MNGMMKKISIYPNEEKDTNLNMTRQVAEVLSAYGAEVCLDARYKGKAAEAEYLRFAASERLFDGADFIVVLGGDGTILRVSKQAAPKNIPILGVNLGRIGFMAELEPDQTQLLSCLFSGEYKIETRMMLDVRLQRNGRVVRVFSALNDAVVSYGNLSRMLELDLYCDGIFVSSYHADGVIVATPTGSTAYSLSAGGSIIDPLLECFMITPICPHSFYNTRPVIYSGGSVLKIVNRDCRNNAVYLTVDGEENCKLECGDEIIVAKSPHKTKLVRIKDRHFYDILYKKISERKSI